MKIFLYIYKNIYIYIYIYITFASTLRCLPSNLANLPFFRTCHFLPIVGICRSSTSFCNNAPCFTSTFCIFLERIVASCMSQKRQFLLSITLDSLFPPCLFHHGLFSLVLSIVFGVLSFHGRSRCIPLKIFVSHMVQHPDVIF